MMGTDKRLSRGERSGRYGPDNMRDDMDWHERRSRYVERDYDRRRADDRHRDRLDDCRDSPERGRKRRHCDSSDDEYDGDHPDQDHKTGPREKNKAIMLRGLPPNITEDEVRAALEQLQGPQPVDIRVVGKMTGKNQDFAFVEFYHLQDSTRWMETNQNKLVIQGKCISVQYSHRKPMYENWLCKSCGLCNFRRKLRCFKCGTARVDGESPAVDGINVEPQKDSDYSSDTLIMRNIAPISTIDGILNILSPYANLSASKIRLIKDKQMGNNKGFGFVQLSSPMEASQLLTVLQSLQPPLKLDGKTVAVDYAKSATRDGAQPGGKRPNHISVASTAIAAAQWSSSQLQPGSDATSGYVTLPEGFSQQSQNYHVWQQQHLEGLSLVNGDGFPGAAPGMKTLLPAATGVVISQTAQIYQPVVFSQTAIQSHHVARAVDAEQQQSVRRDGAQPGGMQANVISVASTAFAATQWSSSQLQPGSDATSGYVTLPEGFSQQSQEQNYHVWQQQHLEGLSLVNGDGFPGAAPGMKTLLPAATGVVISQTAQIYQPVVFSQTAIQSHHVARAVDAEQQQQQHQQQQPASVCTASPVTPAASSVAITVSASPTIKTSAVPDMSTYQYDKDSGYYYDPQTRLYYDPSSQYYYNSGTQQYLYWDGEKQTYVLATEDMMAEQSSSSQEPKGKNKPKTRSAHQIAKNMDRWAKSLNTRKGSFKSSFQDLGPSKEEDKKWSAAADAGFSLFEKKQSRDVEMPSLMMEQFKNLEQETKSDPFVSYNGDSEPEDGGMDGAADEGGRITDWRTGVCLLCQRQFPTKDALLRHQQLSDLHKQNLEIQRKSRFSVAEQGRRDAELKYRDRAAERRGRSGAYTAKKGLYQHPANYGQPTNDGLTSNNIGNHRFQAMGWHEGNDRGHHQQDITSPISASFRTKGTGLGIQSNELSPYDSYEDTAHRAMFARFNEFE
ncbi:RNA-binding protein 5 isoform X2 [Hippoglossus stenolepis]|uniref:RNA-binding protein 5 isoform X2 n=1 Tax=Hippoglossus stenolepis TaxID=195615 RepID=UPI00159C7251|nr:RNA-binding protein 5 isoform X2 [Hippoglossus stenolepis]